MPALGMAQETGRLVRWLKAEGDAVSKGEPLMEVETDKAVVEIEAPASGTLAAVSAAEGEEVAVGHPIAVILGPGETAADVKPKALAPPPAPAPPASAPEPAPAAPGAASTDRPAASPKAKRLAADKGVDLSRVRGTGPGGAIVEDDILQAASTTGSGEPALWRAMAGNVTKSWREAPHFFVMREIDATTLVSERARHGKGVTYTDLLIKAVATALSSHPRMNSGKPEINVGLAVALPDGLIVPVIHGADALSVAGIATRRAELLDRVRSGRVRGADLSRGTFTISNLGMFGVDVFTAILTEGQAGILAVGRIADRVVAREGAPAVRPTMQLSLSGDHRKVDGARAAEFLQTLTKLLE